MRRVAGVEAASQALGHSDLATTLGIYGHQDQRDLERRSNSLLGCEMRKTPRAGGTIRPPGSTEFHDLQVKWRRRESNPRKVSFELGLKSAQAGDEV